MSYIEAEISDGRYAIRAVRDRRGPVVEVSIPRPVPGEENYVVLRQPHGRLVDIWGSELLMDIVARGIRSYQEEKKFIMDEGAQRGHVPVYSEGPMTWGRAAAYSGPRKLR